MEYWRTKMVSFFQMRNVIIIGHSLSDPNIQHVLQLARLGAGIDHPICWVAPEASPEQQRQFLKTYRIRVISYSNEDGTHANLLKYVETLSAFVYQRSSIKQNPSFGARITAAASHDSSASGLYVYNRINASRDRVAIRGEVIASALKGVQTELSVLKSFRFQQALEHLAWPAAVVLDPETERRVWEQMCAEQLWTPVEGQRDCFSATLIGKAKIEAEGAEFRHLQERFLDSIVLRIMRAPGSRDRGVARRIAVHLRNAFVGFFKEAGLTIASVLLNSETGEGEAPVPSSLIPFLNDASLSFEDARERQLFLFAAIDSLTAPSGVEREFLGRLAYGFAAFHALGVFGEVAEERTRHLKRTVWILDSNVLIKALAYMSPESPLIRSTLARLRSVGIRLFSTEKLGMEVINHLRFAQGVIGNEGVNSPNMLAAATGDPPYGRSNLFLAGFLGWSEATGKKDWEDYLTEVFGTFQPQSSDFKVRLDRLGVEEVALETWPGFKQLDFAYIEELTERIRKYLQPENPVVDTSVYSSFYKKAAPEAQALMLVERERSAKYDILGRSGSDRPAYFISETSMLNRIVSGPRVTWSSEGFMRFANTVVVSRDGSLADTSFDILQLNLAQYGKCLLSASKLGHVFSGVVDSAKVKVAEERETYDRYLSEKYGADPDAAIAKLPLFARPMAWAQLLDEISQKKEEVRQQLQERLAAESARALDLEKKLKELVKYEGDVVSRRFRKKRRRRKQSEKKRKKRK